MTQYQSDDQRSEALISHTISTHPCLSWNLLASRLQRYGYSEAAAEVTRKYVKGQLTRLHVIANIHTCDIVNSLQ